MCATPRNVLDVARSRSSEGVVVHSHVVHDIAVEFAIHDGCAESLALEYLRGMEGPWEGGAHHRFVVSIASVSEDDLPALAESRYDGAVVSSGATELWLESSEFCIRIRGLGAARVDLEDRSAAVLVTPEGQHPGPMRDFLATAYGALLRTLGRYSFHGAAAVGDGADLLVMGPSGAGKSTTSMGLVAAGFALVTDDTLIIRDVDGVIEGYPQHRFVSVPVSQIPDPGSVEIAGVFRETVPPKYAIPRRSLCPNAPSVVRPSLLVALQRVATEVSEILPLNRHEAFVRTLGESPVAPASPETASRHLGVVSQLVAQCRTVLLRSGRDIGRDPTIAAKLIRRAIRGS